MVCGTNFHATVGAPPPRNVGLAYSYLLMQNNYYVTVNSGTTNENIVFAKVGFEGYSACGVNESYV